mmetsp:Transcript_88777/g.237528  ORF Transcript_88777/g.237528 Transcript_88777/m.237528 type:complete len:273 (-) Transcript_88777:616-1434(-)
MRRDLRRVRLQLREGLHPVRELPQGHLLEGGLREGPDPAAVGEDHVLHLPVRVDGPLGAPPVEGVEGLPGVAHHRGGGVGEPPGIRVKHHYVHEFHPHVVDVGLLPLQLKPQDPIHILDMHAHELVPILLVVQKPLTQDARVAAHLEGLVGDVPQPGPKHVGELLPARARLLQRHPHVRRRDPRGDAARRRPDAQVRRVGGVRLLPQVHILLDHVLNVRQGPHRPVLPLRGQVPPDSHEAPLRPGQRVGRRGAGPGVRHHPPVRPGDHSSDF